LLRYRVLINIFFSCLIASAVTVRDEGLSLLTPEGRDMSRTSRIKREWARLLGDRHRVSGQSSAQAVKRMTLECLTRFRLEDFRPLTVGIDAPDVRTAATKKPAELYARL
jgi:hypothetical protein